MKLLAYLPLFAYIERVASVCPSGSPFCFDVKEINNTAQFSVSGPASAGYMAIGFGTSMRASEMFIAYFDGSQQAQVLHRQGAGHTQPQEIQSDQLSVSNSLSILSSDKQTIVFTRSLKSSVSNSYDVSEKQTKPMIWSYSKTKPANNRITKHENYGSLNYLIASSNSSQSEDSIPQVDGAATPPALGTPILIHGFLMIISWLALPPIAIFVARFLKSRLGVYWFRLHFGIFILTGVLSLTAILVLVVDIGGFSANNHSIIGVFIMCLYVLQMLLGVFIDHKWSPDRTSIPWYDKLHWWLGRIVYLFALFNILYAVVLTGNLKFFWITLAIILALTVGSFGYGQLKLTKTS